MTDENLMQQVGEGDLDKAAVLFDRYHLHLYNFFRKKGHSTTRAEDLTQNVFERILKYRTSYQTAHSFRAWFFRIARNVEADYFRKPTIAVDDKVEVQNLDWTTDTVLAEMEQKERHSNLKIAMKQLSAEEQELLHFSKFQQMKYREIAAITQLSESAVKVKIHRAIKKLKGHYLKIEQR